MKLNQTNMVSVLSVASGRLSERMRHAAAHLDDGERPEAVAMWFDVSLETVYSLQDPYRRVLEGMPGKGERGVE
jgi:transposase